MSLSNYAKNYYIYKLIMFLPHAMNYYGALYILVIPHIDSHKNKADTNIFIFY